MTPLTKRIFMAEFFVFFLSFLSLARVPTFFSPVIHFGNIFIFFVLYIIFYSILLGFLGRQVAGHQRSPLSCHTVILSSSPPPPPPWVSFIAHNPPLIGPLVYTLERISLKRIFCSIESPIATSPTRLSTMPCMGHLSSIMCSRFFSSMSTIISWH